MTSPFPPTSSPFPFPSFSPFPNPPSVPATASQTPGATQQPALGTQVVSGTGATPAANGNAQLFNPNFLGTGPSPLPFSIPSNPASTTPFPLTSLSFPATTSPFGGLGGVGNGAMNGNGAANAMGASTPWMGGTGFTPNFGQGMPGMSLPGGQLYGLGDSNTGGENDEVGLMKRGLDTAGAIVDRLIVVLGEIGRMEQSLFEPVSTGGEESDGSGADGRNGPDGAQVGNAGTSGRSEGMQVGMGGLSRIEYIQLLSNLQNIATTTLIGLLPSPLSQALPVPTNANATPHILAERSTTAAPSDPAASAAPPSSDPAQPVQPETIASADVGNAPADRLPTIEEITAFAERQANLEFNRREAIRVSAKTVLDVLGKR